MLSVRRKTIYSRLTSRLTWAERSAFRGGDFKRLHGSIERPISSELLPETQYMGRWRKLDKMSMLIRPISLVSWLLATLLRPLFSLTQLPFKKKVNNNLKLSRKERRPQQVLCVQRLTSETIQLAPGANSLHLVLTETKSTKKGRCSVSNSGTRINWLKEHYSYPLWLNYCESTVKDLHKMARKYTREKTFQLLRKSSYCLIDSRDPRVIDWVIRKTEKIATKRKWQSEQRRRIQRTF